MEDEIIKVYVKLNSKDEIIEVNSDIFINDLTNWVLVDEGYGDKYAHAQSQYFKNSLINDEGNYNYKYKNNKIIENK